MARPKSYDREEVLKRARKLFWDKGYEGTHLRELVEVCEISRFSLYQEFDGKQGLFEEALATYIRGLDGLVGTLAAEPLGLDNIRTYFQASLDFGFRHGCFAINTIREKHVVPEPVYHSVQELVRGIEQGFRHNLEAARAAGRLRPGTDIVGQAKLLSAFDMGFLSYGIVDSDRGGLERMIAALEGLWPEGDAASERPR